MVIMIASMGYDEDQIDHDGGKLDDDVDNLKMIVELWRRWWWKWWCKYVDDGGKQDDDVDNLKMIVELWRRWWWKWWCKYDDDGVNMIMMIMMVVVVVYLSHAYYAVFIDESYQICCIKWKGWYLCMMIVLLFLFIIGWSRCSLLGL